MRYTVWLGGLSGLALNAAPVMTPPVWTLSASAEAKPCVGFMIHARSEQKAIEGHPTYPSASRIRSNRPCNKAEDNAHRDERSAAAHRGPRSRRSHGSVRFVRMNDECFVDTTNYTTLMRTLSSSAS